MSKKRLIRSVIIELENLNNLLIEHDELEIPYTREGIKITLNMNKYKNKLEVEKGILVLMDNSISINDLIKDVSYNSESHVLYDMISRNEIEMGIDENDQLSYMITDYGMEKVSKIIKRLSEDE